MTTIDSQQLRDPQKSLAAAQFDAAFQAGCDDFLRAEDGRYILSVKEVIDEGLDPQHYYAGVAIARRSHQRSLDATPPVVVGVLDEY